jgi:hypothetical protein
VDALLARAAAGDAEAIAALRDAENTDLRNPDIDAQFPGTDPPANEPFKVEVKNRTKNPLTKNRLDVELKDANDQIKKANPDGPRHGDIVIDASEAPPGLSKADIERTLRGKMRGAPGDPGAMLQSIDYCEVVYRDPADGLLKRTFMVRTADGQGNGPFTEIFPVP